VKRLIANFEFELPFFLLINVPSEDDLKFFTTIDNYGINIILIRDESWHSESKSDHDKSEGIIKIHVTVSKDENIDPPPIQITPEGYQDYRDRKPYFEERKPEFQRIAREAVHRIILYFKYKLHNPIVDELSFQYHGAVNPEWSDETGQQIEGGSRVIAASPAPGLGQYHLGTKKLSPDDYPDLQAALDDLYEPELYEQFLSDAQIAFFEQNLRRSVLEMAIACELYVKSFFFGNSNLSSITFDYYEDKGRISFRVIDLIDNVAKRAFGVSFKEENFNDFRNIGYLFRARNKIAHRGKILYRDDSGHLIEVSEGLIDEWWNSTFKLISWLKLQETLEEIPPI
jgi:hypothetical protein